MMTYDPRYEGNIPPEFLLDNKMMAQYIHMMSANIEYLESEIKRLDDIRLNTIEKLNELSNKRGVLQNYLRFSENNGFEMVKEKTPDFDIYAETPVSEGFKVNLCLKKYAAQGVFWNCFKPSGHPGPCGGIVD